MRPKSSTSTLSAAITLALAPSLVAADSNETVYTMSNATTGNEVLVFERNENGDLEPEGAFATGGIGTGGSLGNQSGLILDPSDRWLFVVNAGDGTVSSFRVLKEELELVDTVYSGGFSPVSLTVFGKLVNVLNEGDPEDSNLNDNITGFTFDGEGKLYPIPDSTQPLSEDTTDPAQVSFNKEGTVLFVTEKATSMLTTYTVTPEGTPDDPQSRPSAVPTPFGFSFGDRNIAYVTEANAGGPGVVASYHVDPHSGEVSSAIDIFDTENATCWAVLSNDQTIGYATNTGSASISPFRVNFDGTMKPLVSDGNSVPTGEGPLDLVLTQDGENLYTLDSGDDTLSAFRVDRDGGLQRGESVAVPDGANGLAAR